MVDVLESIPCTAVLIVLTREIVEWAAKSGCVAFFPTKWERRRRNGNFFIFFQRHIAKAPTYMHVFLLTLREVMNNFEERGFHYPLAAVRESRYAREDETVN